MVVPLDVEFVYNNINADLEMGAVVTGSDNVQRRLVQSQIQSYMLTLY